MKKTQKCNIFPGCQSIFLKIVSNHLSICILKGSGSNLRVTENLGQNGFVAVCVVRIRNYPHHSVVRTISYPHHSFSTFKLHDLIFVPEFEGFDKKCQGHDFRSVSTVPVLSLIAELLSQ